MSKPMDKKTETTSPTSGHAPETKKTDSTQSSSQTKGAKVVSFAPGACHSAGCKHSSNRMEFCSEHYEQFKFGLIKKTGEPVPDYEKKLEHYTAYKNRALTARKAA